MEAGLPSLIVRVFGNLGLNVLAMRKCSGANWNAQFISYLETQCQCPANFHQTASCSAICREFHCNTAPNPWATAPAVFFPARNKKEHVPIPRMPQRVNCSPAFWITSSEAEHFLYPLYKRGWSIKFQPRALAVSPVNVSHCFYSHSHRKLKCNCILE